MAAAERGADPLPEVESAMITPHFAGLFRHAPIHRQFFQRNRYHKAIDVAHSSSRFGGFLNGTVRLARALCLNFSNVPHDPLRCPDCACISGNFAAASLTSAGKSENSCTWRTSITSLSEAGQRHTHSTASAFDFTWIIQ